MTQQKALILPTKQGQFVVGSVAIPKPGSGQLLIKVQSAALNPIDWKIQQYGWAVEEFPAILGQDIAGIVEEVGEGVTAFVKGDKVVASGKLHNHHAGFQQYALGAADYTAKIPSSISFDQAASFPLGLATAIAGLYEGIASGAGLTAPWDQGGKGKYEGKPIVIFGGSGSVGGYVIQWAKISGFSPIITTASPQHTAYLKSLGATHVLDRHLDLATLPKEIAKITSSPIETVYDAVSYADTQKAAYDLLAPGGTIILVLPSTLGDKNEDGKKIRNAYGSPFIPANREVGLGLYGNLTAYIEQGLIQPNRVEALPDGLGGIVGGLERLRKGEASGVKLVVHPQETV